MKNNLAKLLNNARQKGVTQGIEFLSGIMLIAMNNIADEYLEEKKIDAFFKETEKELNRVYQEVLTSVPSGEIDEMAEKIVYYVDTIRKKRGMDE